MINLDNFFFENEREMKVLPPEHPLAWKQPINTPIYEQDYQWRLKIQPFSQGGFEAKAVLVNRNHLNRLINANRERGRRSTPKDRDEATVQRDREKAAYRAARKVRQICIEIRADRLLTLTSRRLLTDYDEMIAAWKRFMRLLEQAGAKFEYVAVPELHKNGEHYHVHAALNGFVRAELLRRCWQIALGGRGDERGVDALGNVDIKRDRRGLQGSTRRAVSIARYISKYISKSYLEHHQFNRKRYWVPKSVRLPDSSAEWLRAQSAAEAIQELHSRFDTAVMIEAAKDRSLYITEANAPLIFLRYLPKEGESLPTPF